MAQQALNAVGLPFKGEGVHSIRRAVARLLFDTLTEDQNYESAQPWTDAATPGSGYGTPCWAEQTTDDEDFDEVEQPSKRPFMPRAGDHACSSGPVVAC